MFVGSKRTAPLLYLTSRTAKGENVESKQSNKDQPKTHGPTERFIEDMRRAGAFVFESLPEYIEIVMQMETKTSKAKIQSTRPPQV